MEDAISLTGVGYVYVGFHKGTRVGLKVLRTGQWLAAERTAWVRGPTRANLKKTSRWLGTGVAGGGWSVISNELQGGGPLVSLRDIASFVPIANAYLEGLDAYEACQ